MRKIRSRLTEPCGLWFRITRNYPIKLETTDPTDLNRVDYGSKSSRYSLNLRPHGSRIGRAVRSTVGATLSAALLECFVHSLVITPKKKPPQQRQRPQEWARMDSNHRPHGCEPSGLKPLPRTSRILVFANRVVNPRWVAVWTTVGLFTPLWFLFSPGF